MPGYLIGGRLVAGGGRSAGEITVRAVPITDAATFELPHNNEGSLDVTVNLPMVDPVTGIKVDLPNLLVPGRDFIGWVEQTIPGNPDGDVVIEAGPIWGDPLTWPKKNRIIANGLLSYFDHRYVLPVLEGRLPRDVTSKWVGLSLRTIAKRLVQQAILPGSARLPIDFEPDFAGDHEREYPGADLKPVGGALRDLMQVEGGPDITFRPRFTEDRRGIRWAMLTGNPELTQGGDDHYWDTSVDDPHARIANFDRDGSELTSREFQTGATIRNLLTNGSFEDGTTGWTAGTNNSGITVGPNRPLHGSRRAAMTAAGAGLCYLDHARAVTSEPGKVYTFSAHVRTPNALNAQLLLRFIGEEGAIVTQITSALVKTNADDWTRLAVTGTAPNGTKSVNVYIGAQATAAGQTVGIDGAMLTEGTELYPFTESELRIEAVALSPLLTDAGFPLLESVTDRASVRLTPTLQAYANEAVARGSAHVEMLTLVARRDRTPRLGTYWPGDYVTINVGKNDRIPEGKRRLRIVGVQFGKTGDVFIDCAPERVVSGYPVPSTKRTWLRDRLRALASRVSETTRGK